MKSLGAPISLKEAEEMYISALKIKARTVEKIREVLGDDVEAIRFYLGQEIAYIFDRKMLDKMQQMIGINTSDEKKGVVLYIGSKYDDRALLKGRPTLMAFAYDTFTNPDGKDEINLIDKQRRKIEKDNTPDSRFFVRERATTARISVDENTDGEEHPGGGTSNVQSLSEMIDTGLPVSFDPDHIQPGIF